MEPFEPSGLISIHPADQETIVAMHEPLLNQKQTPLYASSVKWILKILMWVVFVAWIALIVVYPSESGGARVQKWAKVTSGTVFGLSGSMFFIFSGPISIITFLAIAHLILSGEKEFQRKKASNNPSFRLWTFPILVDGPFGVVSVAEFIGIVLFAVFIFWGAYAYTMRNISLLSEVKIPTKDQSIWMLELTGLRLGMLGLLCMAFLFLPVARGSVLLQLIDIPFEHATRYHVWLGHLTMLLFTLHGLLYVIGWVIQGRLLQELLAWKNIGISNFPGVISLLAGLLMWVTSLHRVRKHYFELFFYTHQLYVVFVVFLVLHVGDFVFSIAAGGIFLFMLDRFLRFCQSRKTVDVLSASCLPCGTVELVLSKPANLRYNALSFIFLQVRELSWLQWHPFSVSSSPLDGKNHLSVLIKVLGGWTKNLRDILSISEAEQQVGTPLLAPPSHSVPPSMHHPPPPMKITASVEGPYGHEVPYHLMYENLILVAGGIGISPFLAMLSDILHRINEGKPCSPRKVLIVWAVKSSNELPLFSYIDMESICPCFSDKLNLETSIFVTRETEPPLEEGLLRKAMSSSVYPATNGCAMSVLVGTGNNVWSGLYVISSTVGFIVLVALLNILYVNPFNISSWWYKGLLFLACMVGGVLVFGGTVILIWHLLESKSSATVDYGDDKVDKPESVETAADDDSGKEDRRSSTNILYGSRPDFKEIFGSVSKKWGHVDVGVIVCGPPTLQASVAKEIRSHSLVRENQDPIFHFNSHSFDL